jgi:hypothetical protein
LYWFYIGGDIYNERFLLILIPLGVSLFLKIIKPTLSKKILFVSVAAMIIIQLIPLEAESRFRYSFKRYDYFIALGKFLGQKYPEKTLATPAAGKIPFFSGMKTLDMLGLNDLYIAHKDIDYFTVPGHNKYDFDYVLSKKPDFLANFITPELNMLFNISCEKYSKAGYKIKYLINTKKLSNKNDIIDVQSLGQVAIVSYIENGYEFAVLEKNNPK